MIMMGAFAEVFLAKENHHGLVGINLLDEDPVPHSSPRCTARCWPGNWRASAGAGIPREIPAILDRYTQGESATLKLDVQGLTGPEAVDMVFDPRTYFTEPSRSPRLKFLAIVSTHSLAGILVKKSFGHVDGFVVEAPEAGGHNAPPRGKDVNERGEPQYDPATTPISPPCANWAGHSSINTAGNGLQPRRHEAAPASRPEGLQVGTLAFSDESASLVLRLSSWPSPSSRQGAGSHRSLDFTGFPFKVLELPGPCRMPAVLTLALLLRDLGLRAAYRKEDGHHRIPGSPNLIATLKRRGRCRDGRKCLCTPSPNHRQACATRTATPRRPSSPPATRSRKPRRLPPPGTTTAPTRSSHRLPAGAAHPERVSFPGGIRPEAPRRTMLFAYVRWRSSCP
ncbi:MAG: hypothetical protein U1F87_07745 [Kiritimatiellia bacterium]